MSEFRPFIISSLLVGLLALAIISAGIMLAQENDADQSIGDDSSIETYANSLESNLGNASESAVDADNSFRNSTLSLTGGVIFVDAIGGLWKTMTTAPSAVLGLMTEMVRGQILGDTGFYAVMGVITLIIVVTLILAVWKLVGTGEGG